MFPKTSHLFVALGLWASVHLTQAQPTIQSLKQQLARTTANHADTSRSRLLYDLGKRYAERNADSCLYFLRQSLQTARKSRDSRAMARAMNRLAWTYLYIQKDEANVIRWANQAIALAKPSNDYTNLSEGFRYLAIVATHQQTGNPAELFATAIAYAEKSDNWEIRRDAYGSVAQYQLSNKQYAEAEKAIRQGMAKSRSYNLDTWFSDGLDYYNVLEVQGKHEQALAFARQLALVRPQLRKLNGEFIYTNDQAHLARILRDYAGAEAILLKGIALEKQRPNPDSLHLFHYYRNLTETYVKQGAFEKAYKTANDLAEVRLWLQRVRQTRDSKLQMTELKAALALQKKETEITRLNNRQAQQFGFLIVTLTISLLVIGFAFVQQRNQRRIERQRAELSRLNATKDKLFAILSHDLRSPVSNLKSVLTLTDWGVLSQEEFTQSARMLNEKVGSLLTMLENVLTWSLSQMKGIRSLPQRVGLLPLVEAEIDLLRPHAESKQIRILNHIPASAWVLADPNQLRVIVRNLLQNALKFTPTGGTVALTHTETPAGCQFAVSDTGIGMDAQTLAKLFEESGPKTRTGTALESGTGLGLMLAKELVEANGGQIGVVSEVGQGTTFTLRFGNQPLENVQPILPEQASFENTPTGQFIT